MMITRSHSYLTKEALVMSTLNMAKYHSDYLGIGDKVVRL